MVDLYLKNSYIHVCIWLRYNLSFGAGTSDFFGVNHYTTRLVENHPNPPEQVGFDKDQDTLETVDPAWPK